MYPSLSADSLAFYLWALSTTFEDLANDTYWMDQWGLSYNTSSYIAEAWLAADPDTSSYRNIDDAIQDAFLIGITIDYRYTNNDTASEDFSSSPKQPGYYQKCAPYQCVWFVVSKKTTLEIITAIFGILGGVHAVMFVVIGTISGLYRKWKGIKFQSDLEEKEKLETEMAWKNGTQSNAKGTSDGTAM